MTDTYMLLVDGMFRFLWRCGLYWSHDFCFRVAIPPSFINVNMKTWADIFTSRLGKSNHEAEVAFFDLYLKYSDME